MEESSEEDPGAIDSDDKELLRDALGDAVAVFNPELAKKTSRKLRKTAEVEIGSSEE